MMAGSMARSGSVVARYFERSTVCTHGLSTLAKSSCAERSSSWGTSRTSSHAASWASGRGAPKQSELKQAPLRSSNRPMVPGLSKSGGRNAVSVRSPTSSVWPGLSRYSRSIGTGRSIERAPALTNVVTSRARGAASSRSNSPPVWSRSGWVNQIHRTSAGSMTEPSESRNPRSGRLKLVSMTTGSAACSTNALIGTKPMPGAGIWFLSAVMSGPMR